MANYHDRVALNYDRRMRKRKLRENIGKGVPPSTFTTNWISKVI